MLIGFFTMPVRAGYAALTDRVILKKYLYPHPHKPGKFVSKQRVWQLRKGADGCCEICGEMCGSYLCPKHVEAARVRTLRRKGQTGERKTKPRTLIGLKEALERKRTSGGKQKRNAEG